MSTDALGQEQSVTKQVSIVLPTFNQSRYLPQAVQSILKQTYPHFELIIVNDGSTDNTAELLSTIKDPRVNVITQHNLGLPTALNNGFSKAQGVYWTWTSTDNVVAPTWLAELVNRLDQAPEGTDYAMSYYAGINDNDDIIFINKNIRFDLPSLLFRHSGNASFLYRASLAKKVGPYNTSLAYAEDLDMWIRMASVSRAVLVKTVLYYYRIHAHSMTAQQEKVRQATQNMIDAFLSKQQGHFDIDQLFPHIALSTQPAIERWKSRVWLATLGMNAHFYRPIEALVDQLTQALDQQFDRNLISNIVHLYSINEQWDEAEKCIRPYQKPESNDFFEKLYSIIRQKNKNELQHIPFMGIQENQMALDCKDSRSQTELLANLSSSVKEYSFESIVTQLVHQVEDGVDHPETWNFIANMHAVNETKALILLSDYLFTLTQVPQDPTALSLIKAIEALCLGYTGHILRAKYTLQQLATENPDRPVFQGALSFLEKNEKNITDVVTS